MTHDRGAIAYCSSAQSRFLLADILRMTSKKLDLNVHIYVNNSQDVNAYPDGPDRWWGSVNVGGQITPVAFANLDGDFDAEQELVQARVWEKRLGMTYAQLTVADRHLGRGFALLGTGHPRSRISRRSSVVHIAASFNRLFAFWEEQVKEKNIVLFVDPTIEVEIFANSLNIPTRVLTGSKIENLHYWRGSNFLNKGYEKKHFDSIEINSSEIKKMETAYQLVGAIKPKTLEYKSALKVSMMAARHLVFLTYCRLRGYARAKNYYAMDEFRVFYRMWADTRKMTNSKFTVRLADLEPGSYALFPLQTEPESSVQWQSPEFTFQQAAIVAIARELPAGIPLIVKETPHGVGRRPPGFYDQLADFKNIKWLDMFEPGIKAVNNAKFVAVIAGTAGFEATVNGVPAITFCKHNAYNFLDHVFNHTDLSTIGEVVGPICAGEVDLEKARADGARYAAAVRAISFDLDNHTILSREAYGQDTARRAAESLCASVTPDLMAQSAPQ